MNNSIRQVDLSAASQEVLQWWDSVTIQEQVRAIQIGQQALRKITEDLWINEVHNATREMIGNQLQQHQQTMTNQIQQELKQMTPIIAQQLQQLPPIMSQQLQQHLPTMMAQQLQPLPTIMAQQLQPLPALMAQFQRFPTTMAPLLQQMSSLQTQMAKFYGKTNNPVEKGEMGEGILEQRIEEAMGDDVEILSTRHIHNHGDFHVVIQESTRVMVENKTWLASAKSAEMRKFQDELEELEGEMFCDAGVFVSLTSGIATVPQPSFDISPTGKLRFYVPRELESTCVVIALYYCDIFVKHNRYLKELESERQLNQIEFTESKQVEHLKEVNGELQEALEESFGCTNSLVPVLSSLQKKYNNDSKALKALKQDINQLKRVLQEQMPRLSEENEQLRRREEASAIKPEKDPFVYSDPDSVNKRRRIQ